MSSETCYTIPTADDSLVEGVEYFRLAYEILDRHGHFTPSAAGRNVTVAIIDNDSEWHSYSNYSNLATITAFHRISAWV